MIGKPNDIHIRILSFLCSCIIFVFVFGHFWETEYYSYLFNTQLSGTSATVSYVGKSGKKLGQKVNVKYFRVDPHTLGNRIPWVFQNLSDLHIRCHRENF